MEKNAIIEKLILDGYTDKGIQSQALKHYGIKITLVEINHVKNNMIKTTTISRLIEEKPKRKTKTHEEVFLSFFNNESEYLDYAKSKGINPKYESVEQLISNVQTLSAELFTRQALISLRGLELFMQGEIVNIDLLFKSLEITFRILERSFGLDKLVDINAAILTLQSKGFNIDVPIMEIEKDGI